jgi:hypothetical protein
MVCFNRINRPQAGDGGIAKARGCFFDANSGFGAWANAPLVHRNGSTSGAHA